MGGGEEGKKEGRKAIKCTNMYEDTIPYKSTPKYLGRGHLSRKGAFSAKFGVTPGFSACREAASVQPLCKHPFNTRATPPGNPLFPARRCLWIAIATFWIHPGVQQSRSRGRAAARGRVSSRARVPRAGARRAVTQDRAAVTQPDLPFAARPEMLRSPLTDYFRKALQAPAQQGGNHRAPKAFSCWVQTKILCLAHPTADLPAQTRCCSLCNSPPAEGPASTARVPALSAGAARGGD